MKKTGTSSNRVSCLNSINGLKFFKIILAEKSDITITKKQPNELKRSLVMPKKFIRVIHTYFFVYP
jgi:hypothetical protein